MSLDMKKSCLACPKDHIMAIEDEFGFEISDEHAEKLLTPAKIAQYVCDHEQVWTSQYIYGAVIY